MSRWLIAGVVMLTLVACGGPGGTPSRPNPPAVTTAPERPGNPAVYARIEAETDCAVLQQEFDTAQSGPSTDWKVPYMEAADARLREVGCYE